jgi:hypothetical protein
MKTLRSLLAVLLLSCLSFATATIGTASIIRHGATLPPMPCAQGTEFDQDSVARFRCEAGVWVQMLDTGDSSTSLVDSPNIPYLSAIENDFTGAMHVGSGTGGTVKTGTFNATADFQFNGRSMAESYWVCTPQFTAADTITSATNPGNPAFFATFCKIPSGTILAHSTFEVFIGYELTTTATVPQFTINIDLCTISGCATGTIVKIYNTGARTVNPLVGGTQSGGVILMIQGTAAAGGAATVYTSCLTCNAATLNNAQTEPFQGGTGATALAVATNVDEYLFMSVNIAANTAGNSMGIRQLSVKQIY